MKPSLIWIVIGAIVIVALSLALVLIPSPDGSETEATLQSAQESIPAGEFAGYTLYDPAKLAMADQGKVVLFFHASWCPTCRALEADILDNLASIPTDVVILKVDFDTANQLRRQYGVTVQHTLVQVDSQGNQITKFVGSPTLEALLENLMQ